MNKDKKNESEFIVELQKIRTDFNDYTSFVRGFYLKLSMSMIAVNWAVFGYGNQIKSMPQMLGENPSIKHSLLFAIFTLGLTLLIGLIYTIHLKYRDRILQKDFQSQEQGMFSTRAAVSSAYPYSKCFSYSLLLGDIIASASVFVSVFYFLKAIDVF